MRVADQREKRAPATVPAVGPSWLSIGHHGWLHTTMATSRPNDAPAHGAATRTFGAQRPPLRRHTRVRNPVHHTHHYPHHLPAGYCLAGAGDLGSGVQQYPAPGGALHRTWNYPPHVSSDLATGVTPASMSDLPGTTRPLPADSPDRCRLRRIQREGRRVLRHHDALGHADELPLADEADGQ